MSKLSKVLRWIGFAREILPIALGAAGVPSNRIGPIVHAVGEAETALGAEKGADKLAAVLAGEQDVMQAAGASPETIAKVTDTIQTGLAAGIRVVNNVHDLHEKHVAEDAAAAAPASFGL